MGPRRSERRFRHRTDDGVITRITPAEESFINYIGNRAPVNEQSGHDERDWISVPLPLPSGLLLKDTFFTTRTPQRLFSWDNRNFFKTNATEKSLTTVVVLTEEHEETRVAQISLDHYYKEQDLKVVRFPIKKYQSPDAKKCAVLVRNILAMLARGEKILMHCDDGVTRTGMVLMVILRALGLKSDPLRLLSLVNSDYAITPEQKAFAMEVNTLARFGRHSVSSDEEKGQ